MLIVLLCAFSLLAGFIDSVVGGCGLIQIPAMLILLPGTPVATILGTNKFASCAGTAIAVQRYARQVPIDWPTVAPAALCAFAFAFLGAAAVTLLNTEFLRPIVLVLLVAVYVFFVKDLGLIHQPKHAPKKAQWLGILIGAGLGFYDGFFGPGTGGFLIFLFVGVFGFDFLAASASAKVVNLATNVASVIYFAGSRPHHLSVRRAHGALQRARRRHRHAARHRERQPVRPDFFPRHRLRFDRETGAIDHRAVILRMMKSAALLLAVSLAANAPAGEIFFESKPARTHLLELFTSEGCSSCLPAEAWLSNLKNEPRLWQDFVPVAFHVDYWDHLGWRDPFASKIWTERQADYSVRWKKESVYTPAFALDGKEWHYGALPAAASETAGVLKIVVNGDRVTTNFKPANAAGHRYDIHVARLGFSLTADVTAGENTGRKLMHDFVVLGLTNETMKSGAKELQLPSPSITSTDPRMAIAAWVTPAGQIEPIQAVGGWLQ
jgi:uncharacterized protein